MKRSEDARRVGIVILNWNQAEDTLACLKSLEGLDYQHYEVIVVDNGSSDGSPALIRQGFPHVTLIQNPENLGFAGGNNVGIREALRNGADYVLLLNNDTEVARDFLGVLVEAGESSPDIGAVGPKIYYYDPPDVIWSAGGFIDRLGRSGHLRADEVDGSRPDVQQDVDYVTGCAILVKKAAIDRVGILDERFFIYFEESEWCARIKRAGFRVLFVPDARIWHKIEQSARNESRRYLYLMARNRLLYLKCGGAGPWTILGASLDVVRTAGAWALRPRYKEKRQLSSALLLGVRDFALGHFGAPPARP